MVIQEVNERVGLWEGEVVVQEVNERVGLWESEVVVLVVNVWEEVVVAVVEVLGEGERVGGRGVGVPLPPPSNNDGVG